MLIRDLEANWFVTKVIVEAAKGIVEEAKQICECSSQLRHASANVRTVALLLRELRKQESTISRLNEPNNFEALVSPSSQARGTIRKAFYDFLVGSKSEVWLSVIDPLAHVGKTGLFSFIAGREYPIHCDVLKYVFATFAVRHNNAGLPTA